MKVYLAGPITGDTWAGATNWRNEAIAYLAQFGIRGFSPMRGKDFLRERVEADGEFHIEGADSPAYADMHPIASAHGIYKRDRWDVMTADLVLVNLAGYQRVSIGTVMEIAWADAAGKYILVAMEPKNIHDHALLTEAASLVVPTLQEALELIPVILGGSS